MIKQTCWMFFTAFFLAVGLMGQPVAPTGEQDRAMIAFRRFVTNRVLGAGDRPDQSAKSRMFLLLDFGITASPVSRPLQDSDITPLENWLNLTVRGGQESEGIAGSYVAGVPEYIGPVYQQFVASHKLDAADEKAKETADKYQQELNKFTEDYSAAVAKQVNESAAIRTRQNKKEITASEAQRLQTAANIKFDAFPAVKGVRALLKKVSDENNKMKGLAWWLRFLRLPQGDDVTTRKYAVVTYPDYNDWLNDEGFAKHTFRKIDINQYFSESTSKFSASGGVRFWFGGGSASFSRERVDQAVRNFLDTMELSFEAKAVSVDRPWLDFTAFSDRSYVPAVPGRDEILSTGALNQTTRKYGELDDGRGRLPLIPVQYLIVRKVTIKCAKESSFYTFAKEVTAAGGSFSIFGFGGGASGSRTWEEKKYDYNFTESGIEITTPQIIGMWCVMVPLCPPQQSPNPTVPPTPANR